MSNTPFNQPIALQIWDEKYKLVTPNSDIPDDLTVEDTWRRIAKACANSASILRPIGVRSPQGRGAGLQ